MINDTQSGVKFKLIIKSGKICEEEYLKKERFYPIFHAWCFSVIKTHCNKAKMLIKHENSMYELILRNWAIRYIHYDYASTYSLNDTVRISKEFSGEAEVISMVKKDLGIFNEDRISVLISKQDIRSHTARGDILLERFKGSYSSESYSSNFDQRLSTINLHHCKNIRFPSDHKTELIFSWSMTDNHGTLL